MNIQWRLIDGESVFINATKTADNMWEFELPAALQPSIIEWRATLIGDGPNQVTPWFRIAAQEPALEVNQSQVYLQALALSLFFVGLVLNLHKKFSSSAQSRIIGQVEQSTMVSEGPPLPEGGLPDGWTMEQWKWYGNEYLEDLQ